MKTRRMEAREQLQALEAEFSPDDMRAKVTLIRSGVSGNNRDWKAPALKAAAESGFWNGTRMFLDHQEDKNRLPSKVVKRSMKDLVSAIESTEWVPTENGEGKVVGDVVFFKEDFFDFAKRAQKYFGPSVNLLFNGHVVKRNNQRFEVVESLEHSKSVDWVPFPGAGGVIDQFMGIEGEENVEWSEVTQEMLREHRPDLVEAFEAAASPPEKNPEPAPAAPVGLTKDDVKQLLKEAREEWDTEQSTKEAARKQYETRINASGLPSLTRSRLMAAFEGAYDETAVDEAIKQARLELKEAGVGPKVHGMGMSGTEESGESHSESYAPLHDVMNRTFHKSSSSASSQEGAN